MQGRWGVRVRSGRAAWLAGGTILAWLILGAQRTAGLDASAPERLVVFEVFETRG